ncbi:alpha-crystallin B chain-like [Haliotis cracherodii]|uniref:alpha-crystallin B chain-like n=1 Tax=Haliotis cracherodii TaxID=6455 RepID=UPI0039EB4ECF
MLRQIVPRICRQLRNNHIACVRGYRRDLPIRFPWSRSNSPWDSFFSDMRPFFRSSIEDHFRDKNKAMDEMMRRMASNRPMFNNHSTPGQAITRTESAEVKYDKNRFEVKVDVQQYDVEHLKVSQLENRLVISGKHEARADDHGFVSREFTREFLLPENVDTESMTSRLTEDGFLLIEAKMKGAEGSTERVIEIQKGGTNNEGEKKTD